MDVLRHLAVSGPVGWSTALATLVLAFGLGQVVALVYVHTFKGLSYSRTFVQGIALGAVVTCMLLLAIGDSIAAGIGLAGGLSIIRFRTTMRDPRDMMFVFAGLGVGIVCGLQAYAAAIVGTAVFCAGVVLLDAVGFGVAAKHDGVVRLVAPSGAGEAVRRALSAHAPDHGLVTLRQAHQGDVVEHAYHVVLPDPSAREALLAALHAIDGVQAVRVDVLEPTEAL